MFSTLRIWKLTGLLLLINISMFVIEILSGVSLFSPRMGDLLIWGANYAPLTLTGDWWRLLSSMFLHIGLLHLAVNCWALYIWGVYAEFYYGRRFYLAMYLSAGLVGSLLSVIHNVFNQQILNDANAFVVSAGASGAIMGLGGALIVAAWRPKANLHPNQTLQLKPLLVIMAINFGLGLSIAGIDNAAHLGGIITGALLGLVFSLTENMSQKQRQMIRISSFIVLAIIGGFTFYQLQLAEGHLQPLRAGILAQLESFH
ncbi:MAG: rhomboid family intramembrane serine protease [Gammaproteobacteria bacterium]|nr:rhomboid family intramembrane serine protease [Gammaproteobacteria bacterium]